MNFSLMEKVLYNKSENLIIPVMEALKTLGGSGTTQEINTKVVEQNPIPEEIVNGLHSPKGNQTLLENRASWARTVLRHSGFLENTSHGVWAIVPGQQDKPINPNDIYRQYLDDRRSQRDDSKKEIQVVDSDQDDSLLDEREDAWRDELLQVLTETLSPDAFERLAQRLLRECGFIEVQVTGKSGDGGIDGIGIAKVNDLMSFHVIFQCKRYESKRAITAHNIRDFRGAMAGRTDKGLFITTSTFTRDAQKEATRDGAPPIDLINGEQLMDKLKELKMGIKVETVENVIIDRDWYQNI